MKIRFFALLFAIFMLVSCTPAVTPDEPVEPEQPQQPQQPEEPQEPEVITLELFKDGDICDESFREALIDTFLVAAYVYDDEVKIVFNLGGKSEYTSLPFDIDSLTLDETCIDDIKLHQILLYKPFPRPVAVFGDLFVFTQKMQGP